MSVIAQDWEDEYSILSMGKEKTESRASTVIVKHDHGNGIFDEAFYSVHIGNSVLTRKPTRQEIVSNSRASCSNCITF
jgi:hypothetical protein